MSHFTTIQTQIRDLDALHDACGELGLIMLPNTQCRGNGSIWMADRSLDRKRSTDGHFCGLS